MLSGPAFSPASDEYRKSIYGNSGGHGNIYATSGPTDALAFLRQMFPKAEANTLNFVLFSTSGVHGSNVTIEEVEDDIKAHGPVPAKADDTERPEREVTFLLVQPRLVGMTYGNCECKTLDDVKFLKKLRASSWKAALAIGAR